MITLTIRPQALHNAFRGENTVDLRDLALFGTGTEIMWLRVLVCAVAQKAPEKQVSDGAPTRIEFAPLVVR